MNVCCSDIELTAKNLKTFFCFGLEQCRRYGGARGGRAPPNGCLCLPFRFTQNSVFRTSLNDKTTHNNGKRNNYVQTKFSFDVFSILSEIAGNQLLCHVNVTQYSVLLTHLYGCVAESNYWCYVSNYDTKQYVIHFFFKDQLF